MRFSIITPSLNQAEFIRDNIESTKNQDFTDWEHIIMDGGSNDGTIEIIKEYPHLIWKSEKDRGQSHAINKGILQAKGEIIGWINSDDLLCEKALSIVDQYFQKYPDRYIVTGNIVKIDRTGKTCGKIIPHILTVDELLNKPSGVLQCSTFIKKEVFDKVGLIDETFHYRMDRELFIRILKQYKHFIINADLAKFRYYAESKTGSSFIKFERELIRIKRKHHARFFSKGNWVIIYSYLKEPFRYIPGLEKCIRKIRG